jgi:Domain of unknown function (DUF4062)
MPQETRAFLKVLIASPSDTSEERAIAVQVIHQLNNLHGSEEGFLLHPWLWEEDSYSALGIDAQDVINRQLGEYDIFLGIMNTRFGSPTHRADSGTEEEFDRALDKYWNRPDKVRILFYFRNSKVNFLDLDPVQALRVHEFRAAIRTQGLLAKDYISTEQFRGYVYKDLLQNVRELARPRQGQVPGPRPPSTPSLVRDQGDWHAVTKKTSPQWANHRVVLIDTFGSAAPIRLTGMFQSASPFFRFGFKLTALRGRIFGDGTIQSNDNNILIHIGRNLTSSDVFLTRYRNGVRLGLNEAILDYQDCRELPVELAIDNQYSVSLTVENTRVYETFVDREIKARVVLLAWGDEHEYEIDFKHMTLLVG